MYFLREVFPSFVSALISLKILHWVTGLVNFLSGIFEFSKVNSKKMVNIWRNTTPPNFRPTPHLSYLVKQPPPPHPLLAFCKTIYPPISKWGVFTMLCVIHHFKEEKQVISTNKLIGLYVQSLTLVLAFSFSFFFLIVYDFSDWFLYGAVVLNLINWLSASILKKWSEDSLFLKSISGAISWKGQPECENQILFQVLIIWYHWKAETFRNSFL